MAKGMCMRDVFTHVWRSRRRRRRRPSWPFMCLYICTHRQMGIYKVSTAFYMHACMLCGRIYAHKHTHTHEGHTGNTSNVPTWFEAAVRAVVGCHHHVGWNATTSTTPTMAISLCTCTLMSVHTASYNIHTHNIDVCLHKILLRLSLRLLRAQICTRATRAYLLYLARSTTSAKSSRCHTDDYIQFRRLCRLSYHHVTYTHTETHANRPHLQHTSPPASWARATGSLFTFAT